jgi:hypothetical protein
MDNNFITFLTTNDLEKINVSFIGRSQKTSSREHSWRIITKNIDRLRNENCDYRLEPRHIGFIFEQIANEIIELKEELKSEREARKLLETRLQILENSNMPTNESLETTIEDPIAP